MSAKKCLKKARHKLGLSQREFAALLGISYQTLSMWETGARKPSFPNVRFLVDKLKEKGINYEYTDFRDVEG